MGERMILPFGDPVLRKTAKPVEELNARALKILDDMVDTIYAKEGRAGLAAPQIGILRRLVVMDCGDGLVELINPIIREQKGVQTGQEACLSFPGYTGIVKRAQYVKVETLNRRGESILIEAEGYLARCVQHEIDHLNGILFVDRIEGNELYHDETKKKANLLEILRLTRS
ncbi:peptide deformylase [Paenibacillus sp. GD4]|jgi:peptide deformylase|uniref:peptide deformylase n=1 Tax=Paenibacillus sp. GD4 TaxID=3068890 RepID=UPI002796CFC9|nr:peptide deformylase [Paenibacillus sp. GD4]MDQ1914430.1 peptide deformylase [Paenibacillus sp. GD4]